MQLVLSCATRPPYEPFFENLDLGVVCECCHEAEKVFCPHLLDNMPPWKSFRNQETLRALMPDAYFRKEVLGEKVKTEEHIFDKDEIEHFMSKEASMIKTPSDMLPVLFLALDPGGGGKTINSRSNIGTAAVYFTKKAKEMVVSRHMTFRKRVISIGTSITYIIAHTRCRCPCSSR